MVSHCGFDLYFPKDAEYLFCIPTGYPFIFLGDWFQDPQQIPKSLNALVPLGPLYPRVPYQQKIFYPLLTESAEPTGMKGQLYLNPLLFNYFFIVELKEFFIYSEYLNIRFKNIYLILWTVLSLS